VIFVAIGSASSSKEIIPVPKRFKMFDDVPFDFIEFMLRKAAVLRKGNRVEPELSSRLTCTCRGSE
jgi:hypothetical protein